MDESWYYVVAGERKGPVEIEVIQNLIQNLSLVQDDFVWKKGLENWVKIKDTEEFQISSEVEEETTQNILPEEVETKSELPEVIQVVESNSLAELAGTQNSIFIKIGADRGLEETEYGPYSLDIIKKLFDQNRVNGKTFIFTKGMQNWKLLGDFDDFENIFSDVPPPIKDEDRRANKRKPFIARMYIQNQKDVHIGICRDVSVGGMQVLVDHFPGNVGERISINVHPENTDFNFVAAGNIVRLLDGGQGFSFRFVDLGSESITAINKYLENVEG
jgi:hypothetical protein